MPANPRKSPATAGGERTKLTPTKKGSPPKNWRARFLEALIECGHVEWACRESSVSKTTIYATINREPNFKAAVDEAKELAVQGAEAELRRRAVKDGDTTALIFYLKGMRPDVWREPKGPTINLPVAASPIDPIVAEAMLEAGRLAEERKAREAAG